MSTHLLPPDHPRIKRLISMGHRFGQRSDVLIYQAQFLMGADRIRKMDEAVHLTTLAQGYFSSAARITDYSEPEVRVSKATMEAFAAVRAAENAPRPIYPGKGAHWAAKRAAKAA